LLTTGLWFAAGLDGVGGGWVGYHSEGLLFLLLVHRGEFAGVGPEGFELGGVGFAFGPALGGVFGELPVEEAGTETAGDGLGLQGAVVVAEAVVGEAEGCGELPTVAVRAGQEGVQALLAQVRIRHLRQHRVPQLRVLLFVHPPEAFGVEAATEVIRVGVAARVVAVAEEPAEIGGLKTVEEKD
jgi:hypothetical protein